LNMEAALSHYLKAEADCRLECDKPFDMGWYPDFTSSVANHFTFLLKCKVNCAEHLNNFNGEYIDDLVAGFYHYLQFAYYQAGDMEKAGEAAASFLLFNPDHEDMLKNLEYYKAVGAFTKGNNARTEAEEYRKREEDEQALLAYINTNFVFDEEDDAKEDEQLVQDEKMKDQVTDDDSKVLQADEFVAKWSENEGKYVIEDKLDNSDMPKPVLLNPPPVVKFSWDSRSEL